MQIILQRSLEMLPTNQFDRDHFDDLVELDNLAKDCMAPKPSDLTAAVLDHAITVGGISFRALTIAGRLWARDVALPALEGDPVLQSLVIPFAMANRNRIPDLHDPSKVRRAIKRWGRWRCRNLTEDHLVYVLRWFGFLDDMPDDGPPVPDQYGALLALLVKEYGSTPKFWLFEAHLEMVKACLNDVALKNYYEYESMRREAAKGGKAVAPDPNSPQVVAYSKFCERLRQFQEKVTHA